jgi:hypothetical protein
MSSSSNIQKSRFSSSSADADQIKVKESSIESSTVTTAAKEKGLTDY